MYLKRHENIIYSVTSLIPCLISYNFPTSYSKIGILLHYPFRFAFNIHRAFFNSNWLRLGEKNSKITNSISHFIYIFT